MHAWYIDPDFHLPVLRSFRQALQPSIGKLVRRRGAAATPPAAGCGE